MPDFEVYIAQDETTYRYLINNANFESYVRVVKVDAETEKTIPYAGAAFKIFKICLFPLVKKTLLNQ